jgi:hypothetical protein
MSRGQDGWTPACKKLGRTCWGAVGVRRTSCREDLGGGGEKGEAVGTEHVAPASYQPLPRTTKLKGGRPSLSPTLTGAVPGPEAASWMQQPQPKSPQLAGVGGQGLPAAQPQSAQSTGESAPGSSRLLNSALPTHFLWWPLYFPTDQSFRDRVPAGEVQESPPCADPRSDGVCDETTAVSLSPKQRPGLRLLSPSHGSISWPEDPRLTEAYTSRPGHKEPVAELGLEPRSTAIPSVCLLSYPARPRRGQRHALRSPAAPVETEP